uniref:NADH-ubiquinone oxidoreductase chain 4 n=1 Tax=Graffilla buccinicola TaxID=84095 RepID=A0A7G5XUJ0_9PLAT|nr:NADH dehydrogenase subunit 4 [Graffilla buccinicola]QNA49625.1 NADH dehydrogenase subunit 4 [Graffilla buccinicola]
MLSWVFLGLGWILVCGGGGVLVGELLSVDGVGWWFVWLVVLFGGILWVGGAGTLLFILTIILLLFFSSDHPLFFYATFEASLIPMWALIVGFGKTPERLLAAEYFLLYTATASIPLLLVVVSVGVYSSDGWGNLMWLGFQPIVCGWVCMLAFLVKLPLYGVHLWLPKAHVEAPTLVSVILAAVLLKTGVYGIFRFYEFGVPTPMVFWGWVMWGLVCGSWVCFRSVDYKVLVAYSSVVHMGLFLCVGVGGVLGEVGVLGAVLISLGHGFASAGLFFFVEKYYQVVGFRGLVGGVGVVGGGGLVVLVGLVVLNSAIPPSISFVGEVLIMGMVVSNVSALVWGLILYVFLVGLYGMYIYLLVGQGSRVGLFGGEGVVLGGLWGGLLLYGGGWGLGVVCWVGI